MNFGWFTRDEFACKCGCGFAAVDAELVDILNDVREFYESPVIVTSGCRCALHNDNIGGSPGSYHTKGMAADIKVEGTDARDVAAYIESTSPHCGIGLYPSWVHVDVGRPSRRWQG